MYCIASILNGINHLFNTAENIMVTSAFIILGLL